MIKLYGQLRSRASRSLWALEEIGVPYELVPGDPVTQEGIFNIYGGIIIELIRRAVWT